MAEDENPAAPTEKPGETKPELFRAEAVEHHLRPKYEAHLLRLSPGWTRWTFWLVLAATIASFTFLALATHDQYASGPAVVRAGAPGTYPTVIALLPGRYRPLLRPGQDLYFHIDGFPTRQRIDITRVGDAVIGPAEARRALGADIGDAIHIAGPVVIVEARLPISTFATDGRPAQIVHGQPGTAEAVVRRERMLFTLIPALGALFGRDG